MSSSQTAGPAGGGVRGPLVELAAYDPEWPRRFASERLLIERAIAEWVVGGVEHVGSTAVPGLVAKPIIDIMVGVASLEASLPAIPHLEAIGYRSFPYKPDEMHWLCKPSAEHRTHHAHLIPFGGRLWTERLMFRDRLRTDAVTREAYAALKVHLADRYRTDREAYTEAKTTFVRDAIRSATGTVEMG